MSTGSRVFSASDWVPVKKPALRIMSKLPTVFVQVAPNVAQVSTNLKVNKPVREFLGGAGTRVNVEYSEASNAIRITASENGEFVIHVSGAIRVAQFSEKAGMRYQAEFSDGSVYVFLEDGVKCVLGRYGKTLGQKLGVR